jgi:hypothetical protein
MTETIIRRITTNKITMLFTLCILFTMIYIFLDDSHFSGLNKIQETIKDELLKKEVEKEVERASTEPFVVYENYETKINDIEKQMKIDETTQDVKKSVEEQELNPEQIKPSIFQKLFNRLYFSISTGCLLGFGDIYPITNASKTIVIAQALSTIALIIS